MTPGDPLVEVTRRDVRTATGLVESMHTGHLVVTGPDGVMAAVGDPDVVTFVRSTAKPFQATACLELLGVSGVEPSAAEVAVGWSSHRAEQVHIDAVMRLLHRSGTSPDDLTCPPAVADVDPGAAPARISHNCSGKHALFALAGMETGSPRQRLLDVDGPLQRVVLAGLVDAFGPLTAIGVDGCGAPAVAVPVVAVADAYRTLVVGDRFARVREAGFVHPRLVGGTGRLESALLSAGVVAKPGAEGMFAVGWKGLDGSARGLAVKIADGDQRAAATVVATVLMDLEVVPRDTWAPPPPLGGGRPAGSVRATPALRAVTETLLATR